jgi:protein-disulfide isomerase
MVPRVPLYTSARCAFAATCLALLGIAAPAYADSPPAGAATSQASEPVAEVNGKPITMGDLEKSVAGQLAKLDHQRRAVLEGGLGSLIDQKLLEAEAASRGITVEALEKVEIDDKAGQISDADAEAFYKANKARLPPNRSEKQLLPQIKTYLANQKKEQLRDDLLSALRTKYHSKVLLEPERMQVSDAGAPAKGPKDAPVTIIEFSDYQCPFCARVEPALKEAFKTFGDKIRLVYRQFPLGFHANAEKAAEASLCANDQGKFWEMHDAMFADQHALGVDKLKATAARLGLNADQFDKCLDSGKYKAQVQKDVADGTAVGVQGTPTLFINGRVISGAVPFSEIKRVIDDELARKGSAG